jgi:hypothetical protein
MEKFLKKICLLASFILSVQTVQAQLTVFDLVLIFQPTATVADINTIRTQLNATEIGFTTPSRARLWRCSLVLPATVTLPRFGGGAPLTVTLTVPATAPSEAVGVIGNSGQSCGAGINGLYIIPETGRNEIGQSPIPPYYVGCNPSSTNSLDSVVGTTRGQRDVKIAILDSGVDLVRDGGPTTVRHDSIKSWVDLTTSYDFVNEIAPPQDSSGHGTFVAGVAARILKRNNATGVRLSIIKVLDANNRGYEFDIIQAIDYAISKKVDVINCSFISSAVLTDTMQQPLVDVINIAAANGILVVVAAGNAAKNVDLIWHTPVSLQNQGMMTVAATTCDITQASYSNFGVKNVDITAPGGIIYSTWLNNGWATWSGTSFAAPHASAVAGIMMTRLSAAATNPQRVKCAILNSVSYRAPLLGSVRRAGILNGVLASQNLLSTPLACDAIVSNKDLQAHNYLKGIEVFPNPLTDKTLSLAFYLEQTPPNTQAQYTVLDITGRVLSSAQIQAEQGLNTVQIPLEIPSGLFFIQINVGAEKLTTKFSKL